MIPKISGSHSLYTAYFCPTFCRLFTFNFGFWVESNKIFDLIKSLHAPETVTPGTFVVGKHSATKSTQRRSMSSLVQTSTMAVEGLKKRKRDGEAKTKKKVSILEPLQQQGAAVIRIASVVQPQFAAPVVGML
jgi:hypothetical protein